MKKLLSRDSWMLLLMQEASGTGSGRYGSRSCMKMKRCRFLQAYQIKVSMMRRNGRLGATPLGRLTERMKKKSLNSSRWMAGPTKTIATQAMVAVEILMSVPPEYPHLDRV